MPIQTPFSSTNRLKNNANEIGLIVFGYFCECEADVKFVFEHIESNTLSNTIDTHSGAI